jgi:hypothetical protein
VGASTAVRIERAVVFKCVNGKVFKSPKCAVLHKIRGRLYALCRIKTKSVALVNY